jgi:hypothetical protein
MKNTTCKSMVVCLLGLCLPETTAAQPKSVNLEKEVNTLIATMRSAGMKERVKQAAKVIDDEFSPLQPEAIEFFYDIKATNVLLAILMSDVIPARSFVASKCLDAFGPADLAALHKASMRYAFPKPPAAVFGGEDLASQAGTVRHITRRASLILGLKPSVPKTNEYVDVQGWWILALKEAKMQQTMSKALDQLLQQIDVEKGTK